ncbi:MAG: DUF4139 domain-containing protein [Deltaproteobacteria bacterium]|nr:DUF4139 domain-containing protein [Deltaproteobacteria bacterium]
MARTEASTSTLSSIGSFTGRLFAGKSKAKEQLPWTDVGYRPPPVHRDLPAASGYQYTLYASGRHSVAADRTNRRIPLFRRQLRVRPIHRIAPALSKRAYLIGVVKNTTGRPILRGHANLFAGTMFSGRSWLNTALPGRTIRLPLGVDDAVKVERYLRQKTISQGIVFKDDVTEYTVAIEIANNHGYAIEVDLREQIPLPLGRKVEIKGFRGSKGFYKPDRDGRVTWRGKVGARQVAKLSFSFQILRPKDWHLQQHQ